MSVETDAKKFNISDGLQSKNIFPKSDNINEEIGEEYYKKGSENAGLALIFTQMIYEDSSLGTREGADQDEANLIDVFEKYGFEPRVYRDLTTAKIESELKDSKF
jgi:hypothetical protein